MKRLVLDRDMNSLIEKNIKKAWEERNNIAEENMEGETETDEEST